MGEHESKQRRDVFSKVCAVARVGLFALASVLIIATSAGEANDDESLPGGNDTGGEMILGDDTIDFSEVSDPTEVLVGGNDFVLTGDGRHVIALRTHWYGGGGVQTELRSRKLVSIDTQNGKVTGELDVAESGKFGVVLLDHPSKFVLVRRDIDDLIISLDTVLLPSLTIQNSHTAQTEGNVVRLSPSGRYAAIWTVYKLGWPSWSMTFSVPDLVVGIEDIQNGSPPLELSTVRGVADVIAAPDESAFYVALSTRPYSESVEDYHLEIIRVKLMPNLPTTTLKVGMAGHAASDEVLGGSSLRLSPDGTTLTFFGCSFVTGTCNARWYVVNTVGLSLRGDLRAAGASAFIPNSNRAIGWDGASSGRGKIWVETCIWEESDVTDHWLLDVNLETMDSTPIELPKLAPYYFVTRDGDLAVTSVENCSEVELWSVDLSSGETSRIFNVDHKLHHFTVMDDNRTIYSTDKGFLTRIDLEAKSTYITPYSEWTSRVNRIPDSTKLVLAGPDRLIFTLLDVETNQVGWRIDLAQDISDYSAKASGDGRITLKMNSSSGEEGSIPKLQAASSVSGLWISPSTKLIRGYHSQRDRTLPLVPGGMVGIEFRF